MSDGYKYSVQNGDKGLTYIFLQKAKADGFKGDAKDVDWNRVMFTFEQIQREKKIKGDTDSLFSGGTQRNRANWHKNYVIHKGDEINVTDEQLKQIYDAMGFKPEKKVEVSTKDAKTSPPATVKTAPTSASAPPSAPVPAEPEQAPATKEQIQERTEQIAAKEAGNNQDNLFNTVAHGGPIKNLKSSDTIKKEAAAAAEAELNPPAKTPAPAVSTESNPEKPAEPAKKVITAEERQDNFTSLVTGRRPVKKAEPKAPAEAPKPAANNPKPAPSSPAVEVKPVAEPVPATATAPTPAPIAAQAPVPATVQNTSKAQAIAPVPTPTSAEQNPVTTAPAAPAMPTDSTFGTLKTPSFSGQYQIIADNSPQGYKLVPGNIETIGQSEAQKFFQQRPLYTAKTNEWSLRGIIGKDAMDVKNKADSVSTSLSVNTAIYSDLIVKQKAGTPLSEAEKKFMQSHIAELQKHGLQLNDKNEIIEIPKN